MFGTGARFSSLLGELIYQATREELQMSATQLAKMPNWKAVEGLDVLEDMTNKPVKTPGPDHSISIEPNRSPVLVKVGGKIVADTSDA
jgi:hypothetical protein